MGGSEGRPPHHTAGVVGVGAVQLAAIEQIQLAGTHQRKSLVAVEAHAIPLLLHREGEDGQTLYQGDAALARGGEHRQSRTLPQGEKAIQRPLGQRQFRHRAVSHGTDLGTLRAHLRQQEIQ